ncbi:hypothetical protein ELY21_14860 [Legionella sp. km535]|uniref:AAA family ATPase n=1 Tax=Legionella sp. km535 TaxID=2498107 RepID=UPI000F8D6BF8|nr:hypothetical protein ELY21_14860 [Legionella sp. km535]
MNQHYLLTGPPGSGKTSILFELSKRGFPIVEEPARRILVQQRHIDGEAVYDRNPFIFISSDSLIDCMCLVSRYRFATQSSKVSAKRK